MKLFLGSTVFIAFTCFASLAIGQTVSIWTNTGGSDYQQSANWSNGIPLDSTYRAVIMPGFTSSQLNPTNVTAGGATLITINNNTSGVTVGALSFFGNFDNLGSQFAGTATLNFTGAGSNLTVINSIEINGGDTLAFNGDLVFQGIPTIGYILIGDGTSTNGGILDPTIPGAGTLNLNSGSLSFDYTNAGGNSSIMVIGQSPGNVGTVNQGSSSGGAVTVATGADLIVGNVGGSGTYNVTNGSILQTGSSGSGAYYIILGNGNNSTGVLNISDNSQFNLNGPSTYLYVGEGGSGTINQGTVGQSGGPTVNVNSSSEVDVGEASAGVYNLNAGTLNVNNTANFWIGRDVGGTTTGVMNQAGGSLNVASGATFVVGAAGSGQYNLTAGTATFTGVLIVGNSGDGVLNQSGNSTLTAVQTVDIGRDFSFSGGKTGVYNLLGGTALFEQSFFLGDIPLSTGNGTINQSGGSLTTQGMAADIGIYTTGAYNLSGGTADFQAGLTVGAFGTLNQTGGTLTTEGAAAVTGTYIMAGGSSTFNNSLSIGGELDLNGGTLQVDLNQISASGIVNLGGGTLKLTGSSATPFQYSFNGSLTGGTSTIDVSSTNLTEFDFMNPLSGPGGIALVGNGDTAFFFSGSNSYTGSTSIQNGFLEAAQDEISSSSSLIIGSTGELDLGLNAGGFAYAGSISGPGVLTLSFTNAGDAFVMSNASNFTGNIVVGATGIPGVLQVYSGTFNNISDNGSGSGVTIGGTPLAAGGPAIPVSGTVVLPGANSYSGLTTISPNFTVKAATFTGSVLNQGTLSTLGTQSAPSNLTIGGDLTSLGVITGFLNGVTADSYLVNGGGGATLSGTVSVKGSGTKQYAVLTAGSGITIGGNGNLNDPNGLTTNAPTTLFSSTLTQIGNILYVNTIQNPLAGFAQTPNQRAVASVLDPLTQTPPPAFVPLLTAFNSLSASQIPVALEQLTPESLQYPRNIAFENSTFLVQKVNSVLGDIRSGYTGLDANGLSYSPAGFNSSLAKSLSGMLASNAPSFHTAAPNGVNYYPDDGGGSSTPSSDYDEPAPRPSRMTPAQAATPTTYDGQVLSDSPIPMRTSEPPTLRTSQFTEFVSGDVILSDINQNQNMPSKASYTAGDIMAGVGFRVSSNITLGVLFDYNHTNAKTDANGSKTTVDSYSPGIFATYYKNDFYVNGLFSFGYNQYNNTRSVPIAGGTATSNPNGQQYVGDIDFGYHFHPAKNWVVTPTLGVTYTHLDVDAFSESGVPSADLNVNSQSVDSLRSRLGGQLQYMTHVGNMVLQPNLTAMWQHEYLDNGPGITSNFQAYGTGPFTIQTAAPTKDSALLGAGLTATLNNSLCFYLDYMADVGGGDYLAQSIVGGVKASF